MDSDNIEVPLLYASAVSKKLNESILRVIKINIAKNIEMTRQLPMECEIARSLNEELVAELETWAGKYGWKLSYYSKSEKIRSENGGFIKDVYYVKLDKA